MLRVAAKLRTAHPTRRFTRHRVIPPVMRHYDHAELENVSMDSVTSPAALEELAAFCQTRKLKPTVYTGAAGLALALWRAGSLQQRQDWLDNSRQLAAGALAGVSSNPRHFVPESLLDGTAGVVAVNCLITAGAQSSAGSLQAPPLLQSYTDICHTAAGPAAESDEFLYGRAGTLFGALLLRQQLGEAAVPDDAVSGLVCAILTSGRALAAQLPVFQASNCPLAYVWPPSRAAEPYLGAAHGLMGILYVLLHCEKWLQQDATALQEVQDCLRFVRACEVDAPGATQGSGGHYPTLMRLAGTPEHADRHALVHWCHGAPGAVYLWCKAYEGHEAIAASRRQVFGDPSYLQAALRGGEVVWQRGLLKKGPGLCHGVAGNAYAFLRLWKTTQDPVWLERGQLFAAFLLSPTGKADWYTPDHPTSLYEGAAGAICLLAELQAALQGRATDAAAAAGMPAGAEEQTAAAGAIAFPLFELWRS